MEYKTYTIGLFIVLFEFSFCFGEFKRDAIDNNSNSLQEKVIKYADKQLKRNLPLSDDSSINTVLVYKQIVNGINYKLFTVVRDKGFLELFETVVYTGPFSKENKERFEIISREKVNMKSELNDELNNSVRRSIFEKTGCILSSISYANVYSTTQSGDEILLVEFGYRKSESRPSVIMFVKNKNSSEYIFYEY